MTREVSASESRHSLSWAQLPVANDSVWSIVGCIMLWANTLAVAILTVAVFMFVSLAERPHLPCDTSDLPEPILNATFRLFTNIALLLSAVLQFTSLFLGALRKSDAQTSFAATSLILILAGLIALRLHGAVQ